MKNEDRKTQQSDKNKSVQDSIQSRKDKREEKKESKNKTTIIVLIISAILILLLVFVLSNREPSRLDNTKQLPTIENVDPNKKASKDDQSKKDNKDNNNTDKKSDKNQKDNKEALNGYQPAKDLETKITDQETNEYKAAKIANSINSMVNDAIITKSAWEPQGNDSMIAHILGDKAKIKFEYDTSTFDDNLRIGGNNSRAVPVIICSPVKDSGSSAKNLYEGYDIKKINDNQYEATFKMTKAIVPNDLGLDIPDLIAQAKSVFNDYEKQGTLDKHTYTENEKLLITKSGDNTWNVKFANKNWYMPNQK